MIPIFDYVQKQVDTFFPMETRESMGGNLFGKFEADVLKRYAQCVSTNNILKKDPVPDPFHIMKYPIFLYLLSRSIYESDDADEYRLKDRLHAMNKMLHGCSIYFTTALKEKFFLNYATGIVFAPAVYGTNFVSYHGVSITENNGVLPVMGDNVTLMPGTLISGATVLGNHVTVSAGTKVIDKEVPSHSVVFQGSGNELVIKPAKRNYSAKYFAE